MTQKIFVGGLPWATRDDELRDAFVQFGDVMEAKVILDRATGRSRGFGFVTFTHEDAAKGALEMNGQELGGRTIRVDLAFDKPDRGPGRGGPPRRDQY